jgi:hypothetical protein
MGDDAKRRRKRERPKRGLDSQFLDALLEAAPSANAAQPAEPPPPPNDGPGARLMKWRKLTGT